MAQHGSTDAVARFRKKYRRFVQVRPDVLDLSDELKVYYKTYAPTVLEKFQHLHSLQSSLQSLYEENEKLQQSAAHLKSTGDAVQLVGCLEALMETQDQISLTEGLLKSHVATLRTHAAPAHSDAVPL